MGTINVLYIADISSDSLSNFFLTCPIIGFLWSHLWCFVFDNKICKITSSANLAFGFWIFAHDSKSNPSWNIILMPKLEPSSLIWNNIFLELRRFLLRMNDSMPSKSMKMCFLTRCLAVSLFFMFSLLCRHVFAQVHRWWVMFSNPGFDFVSWFTLFSSL